VIAYMLTSQCIRIDSCALTSTCKLAYSTVQNLLPPGAPSKAHDTQGSWKAVRYCCFRACTAAVMSAGSNRPSSVTTAVSRLRGVGSKYRFRTRTLQGGESGCADAINMP